MQVTPPPHCHLGTFIKLAAQRYLSLLLLHLHSQVTSEGKKDGIKLVIMTPPLPFPSLYIYTLGFQE